MYQKEITREIIKYIETNKNEYTTYQNLCDVPKEGVKRKFTAFNAYIKKEVTKSITYSATLRHWGRKCT